MTVDMLTATFFWPEGRLETLGTDEDARLPPADVPADAGGEPESVWSAVMIRLLRSARVLPTGPVAPRSVG